MSKISVVVESLEDVQEIIRRRTFLDDATVFLLHVSELRDLLSCRGVPKCLFDRGVECIDVTPRVAFLDADDYYVFRCRNGSLYICCLGAYCIVVETGRDSPRPEFDLAEICEAFRAFLEFVYYSRFEGTK